MLVEQECQLVVLQLLHLDVSLDIIMIQQQIHAHHVELELMHVHQQQLHQVVLMDIP